MPFLKKIRIGALVTENNVFLAPLAGIGDRAYRTIGMRFGAGLAFTEMVSAHGLANESRKTLELLLLTKKERPAGIQIFGSNPEVMGSAAALCGEYPADLLDINAGCSVRKVLKTGAGAGMLGDPERFFRVVKACVEASRYPVSVKLRLGLGEDSITVLENALAAQDAGASLLTVHPRTARDGYGGKARWEYIALVKERVRVPVCGNGDIAAPSDAVRMVRETGCDAVMIGRAAIGNPWLIRETVRALSEYPEQTAAEEPSLEERVELALEHLRLIVLHKGEARGLREAKRHLHRYLRGVPRAARVRERIFGLESLSEAEVRLRDLVKAEKNERRDARD
jgi:nifR3 family TIM-barrel protein